MPRKEENSDCAALQARPMGFASNHEILFHQLETKFVNQLYYYTPNAQKSKTFGGIRANKNGRRSVSRKYGDRSVDGGTVARFGKHGGRFADLAVSQIGERAAFARLQAVERVIEVVLAVDGIRFAVDGD